jgi:hypothetical protein
MLRAILFAVVTAITVSVAFVVAHFAIHGMVREIPTAPVLALLLLAACPLLARLARPLAGARAPVVAALAVAALAPFLLLGSLDALSDPLLHSDTMRCGTSRLMFEQSVVLMLLPVGVAAAFGALLVASRPRPRVDRGLRWFGQGLGLACAILLAAALVRAVRFPAADDYVRSLPVVARVRAASGVPTKVDFPAGNPTGEVGPAEVYDDRVEGVTLRRTCFDQGCRSALVTPGTPPATIRLGHTNGEAQRELLVRRDAAHDLWVVEGSWPQPFLGADLHDGDVTVRGVASAVSPARGWLLGAAAGLLVAGLAMVRRRQVAAFLPLVRAGREGVLEANGLVTLTDGDLPLPVAPGPSLAAGPVVVLPAPLVTGGTYRGEGPPREARVLCGTRDALLASVQDRLAHLDALTVTFLLLLCAPLLACAVVGIVF